MNLLEYLNKRAEFRNMTDLPTKQQLKKIVKNMADREEEKIMTQEQYVELWQKIEAAGGYMALIDEETY